MKFGAAIPNCREGKVYTPGFTTAEILTRMATLAEELGFDALWANDLQSTFDEQLLEGETTPPNFFEALATFAYLAGQTSKIRFLTSAITVPLREPVLFAKQAATVDQLSGGRLSLGVGVGGKRTELDRLRGSRSQALNRGRWLDESLQLLTKLFTERSVTHEGEYFSVQGAEVYPKPAQSSLPLYLTGASDAMIRRAARYGRGWIHMHITPEALKERIEALHAECAAVGRDAAEIDVSIQFDVLIAPTRAIALERWERSLSARLGAARGRSAETSYLIGTPDEVTARLKQYEEAGMTNVGLIFSAASEDELMEQILLTGRHIIPEFASTD